MPFPPQPTLGFIGAGRLARTLAAAWHRRGYRIAAVASRSEESSRQLAERAGQCQIVSDLRHVIEAATLVFVTVPDDAIGAVAAQLCYSPARAGSCALVHCSGASSVELLEPARAQGVLTGGFHPLYLFTGHAADVDRLAGCSITIEAPAPLDAALRALAGALDCVPLSIPSGTRMLYHGAASYAASFAVASLYENVTLWKHIGLDEDAALAALLPMLERTLQSVRDKGLSGAIAGPVSRGDVSVIRSQLDTLAALGEDHMALYAMLTRRVTALARRRSPAPSGLDAIEATVNAALQRGTDAPAPDDGAVQCFSRVPPRP
ncbi:DUF2520 domain-containing protein [Mycetohabitans sp. B8]|uniref:Rossmann-like and DUF2520 domain-containing protein n=1 Tax=Mycetohabitans sp. B8 TaxID=2841845 RepID=UPI001F420EC5|nr:DUF2520 domain-containing protein [Mycetohabitans sp. B8]MCG1043136.1 DUF2520 domain-containing protein [Mycetohabitans sp. B8]